MSFILSQEDSEHTNNQRVFGISPQGLNFYVAVNGNSKISLEKGVVPKIESYVFHLLNGEDPIEVSKQFLMTLKKIYPDSDTMSFGLVYKKDHQAYCTGFEIGNGVSAINLNESYCDYKCLSNFIIESTKASVSTSPNGKNPFTRLSDRLVMMRNSYFNISINCQTSITNFTIPYEQWISIDLKAINLSDFMIKNGVVDNKEIRLPLYYEEEIKNKLDRRHTFQAFSHMLSTLQKNDGTIIKSQAVAESLLSSKKLYRYFSEAELYKIYITFYGYSHVVWDAFFVGKIKRCYLQQQQWGQQNVISFNDRFVNFWLDDYEDITLETTGHSLRLAAKLLQIPTPRDCNYHKVYNDFLYDCRKHTGMVLKDLLFHLCAALCFGLTAIYFGLIAFGTLGIGPLAIIATIYPLSTISGIIEITGSTLIALYLTSVVISSIHILYKDLKVPSSMYALARAEAPPSVFAGFFKSFIAREDDNQNTLLVSQNNLGS